MPLLFLRNRNFYIMLLLDALLVAAALLLAFALRFDGTIPAEYHSLIGSSLPWLVPLKVALFYLFGLYHGMWRYTSLRDLRPIGGAAVAGSLLFLAVVFLVYGYRGLPRSIPLLDFGLTLILIGGLRIMVRLLLNRESGGGWAADGSGRRVVILGAGQTGERLIREMHANQKLHMVPVAIFDDNAGVWGKRLHGVRVRGGIDGLATTRLAFDEILIALPAVKGERIRHIVTLCEASGRPYRIIPNLAEIMNGQISIKTTRRVRLEDLLGREEVRLERELLLERYADKRVLVTGAGGSIGSELVRQIGHFSPQALALLDFSEYNLFSVDLRARQLFPAVPIQPLLVDIRDAALVQRVLAAFQPQVILHAAAYKHVPLQEITPWEAVVNNVGGTQNLVDAALSHAVERFVLVSTDKAVRPSSVMGATKRLTEMLTECANGLGNCRFSAVRFGNVLGSSGSVVPIFESQIAAGLPVTVTHSEVTRYFMSVAEAAQLILQAGAMAEGGEIFILDMGAPVRIADMARDLIRLHGLVPETDIPIIFTGLRPGEKLYEELITAGEGIGPTRHARIRVIRGTHCQRELLQPQVAELLAAARRYDATAIKAGLQALVPEYQSS